MYNEKPVIEQDEFTVEFEGTSDALSRDELFQISMDGVKDAIRGAFEVANKREGELAIMVQKIQNGKYQIVVHSVREQSDKYGITDVLSSLGFMGKK